MESKEKYIRVEYARRGAHCTSHYRRVLLEDGDGGGDGGGFAGEGFGGLGGYGSTGLMGGGLGIGNDLMYKTFVKGWIDVLRTATSGVKSMTTNAAHLVKVALDSVANAIIPFYRSRYKEIFESHKQAQQKIRQEFAPVYKSVTAALASNPDFHVSAFMYDPSRFFDTIISNPSAFVTTMSVANAPDAVATALDTLSGGMFGEIMQKVWSGSGPARDKNKWKEISSKLKKVVNTSTMHRVMGANESSFIDRTLVLVEDGHCNNDVLLFEVDDKSDKEDKEEQAKAASETLKYMLHPNVLEQVLQSKKAQDMVRKQRDVTNNALESLVQEVEKLSSVNSLDTLESLMGKEIKVPDDLDPSLERDMIEKTKQSVKDMYVKMLTVDIKPMLESLPNDHALVKAYMATISAIKKA